MTTQLDMDRITRDDRTVAASLDVDRMFGVLKRTFDVPVGLIAVASLKDGEDRVATVKILATAAEDEETPEGEEEKSDQPEMIGRIRKDEDSDAEKSS